MHLIKYMVTIIFVFLLYVVYEYIDSKNGVTNYRNRSISWRKKEEDQNRFHEVFMSNGKFLM